MATRNRSLTGCSTCRSRHLKCDETRPGCQLCLTFGLPCPGYQAELKWTQYTHFQSKSRRKDEALDRVFRRQLFSEIEQESMTRLTVESLGTHDVNEVVDNLDRENHAQPDDRRQSLLQGPFGVFNAAPNDTSSVNSIGPSSNPGKSHMATPQQTHAVPTLPNSPLDSWTPGLLTPSSQMQTLFPSPGQSSESEIATIMHQNNYSDGGISALAALNHSPFSPSSATTAIQQESFVMPERAPQLLRYFKNEVGSLSYPLRGNKRCPWQTIHLPRAEKAYAELLLHQTASNTLFCLFYSLLAASCYHLLYKKDSSLDWESDGKKFHELSRRYLELGIRQEIAMDGKVKYKELLMALLSMTMLEIACGKFADAQNLLVESECLIRKRGLSKAHKSVKVRILHHVYTYIRIMAESTCGCALMDICPTRPSQWLASDETNFASLRSFRVVDHSTTSDLDSTLEKTSHIGTNDIHLEILGVWKESLFQELYGLPESLIGLLSQTIRLANEQELLHRDTTVDIDLVLSLNERTKTLEHQVLSWKGDQAASVSQEDGSRTMSPDSKNTRSDYAISLVVHQGLILFYYRRMHNMNALILQDTVRKVLGFVKEIEISRLSNYHREASLLWPTFIAACEALEPELQTGLLDWIASTGTRTSIPAFAAAADVVQRVWEMRQEKMDYTLSWFNVMEHDRCPIIVV
ncbi:unnamed protein product [Penicillium salamii]|nr:unnamed protein product [Penicillium salamii]CAG8176180.1 unnamed protein product [Penicillium salamii]CAG8368257.1 unnamed protein product [Penicillium salamii]